MSGRAAVAEVSYAETQPGGCVVQRHNERLKRSHGTKAPLAWAGRPGALVAGALRAKARRPNGR